MSQTLQRGTSAGPGISPDSTVGWREDFSSPVAASRFESASGVVEWQVVVFAADSVPDLEALWLAALREAGIRPDSTVMRHVFRSDGIHGKSQLDSFSRAYPGGFSAIGQPPLAGGRFAMWSYHVADGREPLSGSGRGDCFTLRRGSLLHFWMSGLCDTGPGDSASQTHRVLKQHNQLLAENGMSLEDNVIRTWWYVRDIDNDYQGLVEARREVFARHGLTEDTHYIASTGIAGGHHQQAAKLSLDSYAIRGLVPGQVEHLSAPAHLGPTHSYGVTFERATSVSYSDRTHIFLSGTASIDPAGDIVHPGDVMRQLDRTLLNIEALLASAHAGLRDLSMILVYLRHPGDGPSIRRALRQRFADLPMIVLHAPVCRPGWLVEIEGIACISTKKTHLPDF
jgi:enamine deaminase RidA (YjgF/YER057c/UK114 family)